MAKIKLVSFVTAAVAGVEIPFADRTIGVIEKTNKGWKGAMITDDGAVSLDAISITSLGARLKGEGFDLTLNPKQSTRGIYWVGMHGDQEIHLNLQNARRGSLTIGAELMDADDATPDVLFKSFAGSVARNEQRKAARVASNGASTGFQRSVLPSDSSQPF